MSGNASITQAVSSNQVSRSWAMASDSSNAPTTSTGNRRRSTGGGGTAMAAGGTSIAPMLALIAATAVRGRRG